MSDQPWYVVLDDKDTPIECRYADIRPSHTILVMDGEKRKYPNRRVSEVYQYL